MSETQACEVPIVELAAKVPEILVATWSDGEYSSRTAPVGKYIHRLLRELAAERERADRNQEDAERYRYLRIHPSVASETLPSSYQRFWCLVELDAAIDAARRK